MSDSCLHIVPIYHKEYQNSKQKAQKILEWFISHDMVEKELSECTLEEDGYRFKSNIISIFNENEFYTYKENLQIYGLEITAGDNRRVFHPMEGMYLEITCPKCKQLIDNDLGFDWVGDWADGQDLFICPFCNTKNPITKYEIEPNWGFSNIAITLWNTPYDLKEEFIKEMEKIFKTSVKIIEVRI